MRERLGMSRILTRYLWALPCIAMTFVACVNGSGDSGCDGEEVGGSCWYLGELGESCREVCDEHGGFDDATITFAGAEVVDDRSNEANCQELIDVFSTGDFNGGDSAEDSVEVGCVELTDEDISLLVSEGATTETAGDPFVRRFCACNE